MKKIFIALLFGVSSLAAFSQNVNRLDGTVTVNSGVGVGNRLTYYSSTGVMLPSAIDPATIGAFVPANTVDGYTLRGNGSSWVESSLLYNSGTRIGINTTSPGTAVLNVNTAASQAFIDHEATLTSSDYIRGFAVGEGRATGDMWLSIWTNGSANDAYIQAVANDASFEDLILNPNGGNVAVATTPVSGVGLSVGTVINAVTGYRVNNAATNGSILAGNGTNIVLQTPATLGLVTTLAAVGASPNANGASISGATLTLQPANATNPGVVTTATQNFSGTKRITATNPLQLNGLQAGAKTDSIVVVKGGILKTIPSTSLKFPLKMTVVDGNTDVPGAGTQTYEVIRIPACYNGYSISDVSYGVWKTGATGTAEMQIRKNGSGTAGVTWTAGQGVKDVTLTGVTVATGDIIDVEIISNSMATPQQGLWVTIFLTPK